VENLERLHRREVRPRRRVPFALAVLFSVLLWVAMLALLVALLS
jgi:hypothetical protein